MAVSALMSLGCMKTDVLRAAGRDGGGIDSAAANPNLAVDMALDAAGCNPAWHIDYSTPGCGDQAVPICSQPTMDTCARLDYFCDCDGNTTIEGTCGFSPVPYLYAGPCRADAGPDAPVVTGNPRNVDAGPPGPPYSGPGLLTPSTGMFAADLNVTSSPIVFSLANPGSSASGALTATLMGADPDQFAIAANTCVGTLAPLSTCTLTVVFKPTTAGTKTATMIIIDSTPGSLPVSATLTGTPVISEAPEITGPADFGNVPIGQTSRLAVFSITNSGMSAVSGLTVAVAEPQFVVSNDMCSGIALAAAKTCTFAISFAPSSRGVQPALVTVSQAGTLIESLQIQGTGVLSGGTTLSLTPLTVDFGTVGVDSTSNTLTIAVTNTGATSIGSLTVQEQDSSTSVGGASQFSFFTACQGLAPGGICGISVIFHPTQSGSSSATLTVSDRTGSSQTTTLVGIGLAASGNPDAGSGSTLLSLLPTDNEIGAWTHSSTPVLAYDETGLVSLIDGAGAQYIDHGWVGGVFADYGQADQTMSVAIHDMANGANAQSIYSANLPTPHQAIGGLLNAVADMGTPTGYNGYGYVGRFYIELTVSSRSAAGLTWLQQFMTDIYARVSKL
jgi:hypothetical protein